MEKLNLRTIERDGLIVEIYRVLDGDCTGGKEIIDTSRYDDVDDPIERAKYIAEDEKRYEAWMADEWSYVGVCVDVRIKTATNWAELPLVGRASIWGVESDSDDTYFAGLEEELIADALEDVNALRRALCADAYAVLGDCKQTLDRLPNVDGAYRVTVLKEINMVLEGKPI